MQNGTITTESSLPFFTSVHPCYSYLPHHWQNNCSDFPNQKRLLFPLLKLYMHGSIQSVLLYKASFIQQMFLIFIHTIVCMSYCSFVYHVIKGGQGEYQFIYSFSGGQAFGLSPILESFKQNSCEYSYAVLLMNFYFFEMNAYEWD